MKFVQTAPPFIFLISPSLEEISQTSFPPSLFLVHRRIQAPIPSLIFFFFDISFFFLSLLGLTLSNTTLLHFFSISFHPHPHPSNSHWPSLSNSFLGSSCPDLFFLLLSSFLFSFFRMEGQYLVLYDYQATGDNGLNLRQGETVLVHEKGTTGWWNGETSSGSGWFPESYVQKLVWHFFHSLFTHSFFLSFFISIFLSISFFLSW